MLGSYVVVAHAAVGLPLYPLGAVLLADVVVTVTVVARQLIATQEHARLAAQSRRAATTDGLTGLIARAHFLELADAALHDADELVRRRHRHRRRPLQDDQRRVRPSGR